MRLALRKRHLVTLAALLAAFLVVGILWYRTPIVSEHVGQLLTQNLLAERGLRLELDAVRTTWRGEALLVRPRVLSATDSSQVVLRADALRVRLRRPFALIRGRVVLGSLRLDRPHLRLPLPPASPEEHAAEGRSGDFPRLVIDDLQVTNGTIERPGPDGGTQVMAEHLDARLRVRSRRRQLQATLENARVDLPADSVRILEVAAQIVARADTVWANEVRIRTERSSLSGALEVQRTTRTGTFDGRLAPLDLAEATRLADQTRRVGALSGPVHATWGPGRATIRGTLDGDAEGLEVAGLELVAALDLRQIDLQRAEGVVNGSAVRVDARLVRGSDAVQGTADVENADLRVLLPPKYLPPTLARAPDHELSGRVHFARDAAGDSLRFDVVLKPSEVRGVLVDMAHGTIVVRGDDLEVRDAEIHGPLGELRGAGTIQNGVLEARFDADLPAIEDVLVAADRSPSVRGPVRLHGRASGDPVAPHLELEGEFAALDAGAAQLWSGNVAAWGIANGPHADLDLELHADSARVRSRELFALAADMNWSQGRLRITRSQATAGDTLIAAAGTVTPLERDWQGVQRPMTRIELETALLRLGEAELRVEDPAVLWWGQGAVRIDSLQLVTRGGTLEIDGSYDPATRAVAAKIELEAVDLGFLRQLVRVPVEIGGTGSGWLDVGGTLDRSRIRGRFEVVQGSINGLPIDSLEVELAGTEAATDIPRIHLVTPHGSLHGSARLGLLPSLARWFEQRRYERPVEELENATVSAVFDLQTLDLDRLWQARAPDSPPPDWSAQLSSFVGIRGTLGDPIVELRGRGERLRTGSVAADGARMDLVFRNDSLIVNTLEIASEGQTMHVSGMVPAQLHLLRGVTFLRDRPLSGRIVLPRTSFAIVERFVPTFTAPPLGLPRGEVEIDLVLGGTIEKPQPFGRFRAYDASFQLANMEEIYRDVDASGEFDGEKLTITELRASTGQRGTVTGTGTVGFSGFAVSEYAYALQLDNVPVYSIPEMTAVVTGRLDVDSRRIASKLVPRLRGTLDILSGEIQQEFQSSGATVGPTLETDVPDWLADDLVLRAEKGNLWIRNSLVDAELQGNITLIRDPNQFQVLGVVRVKRGTYSYLVHRFEIERGTLDFSRNLGFNPELDIEGRRGRPGQRIYVRLTGTAEHPQLAFSSDRPDESADQVEQILLGGTASDGEAAAIAAGNFAEQVVRDLAIISEFSIDPTQREGASSAEPSNNVLGGYGYNVSGGRPIGDRLFVLYTQGFYSDIEQRVAVEFDINRWLLMEGSYERRSVTEAGPNQSQNAFGLNLKYRHEY